jgi:hypothetical protein
MLEAISRTKYAAAVEEVRQYARHGRPGYVVEVIEAVYPRLVVRLQNPKGAPFYLRIDMVDWNSVPASYQFVKPDDFNQVLSADHWPGQPFLPEPDGRRLHNGPFRNDNQLVTDQKQRKAAPMRPFICLRGTREYHRDLRHRQDQWFPLRGDIQYGINSMIIAIQERIYRVTGAAHATANT